MTEFILALPFLLLVLALMLFMGWQMMRTQHLTAATRYTVWSTFETSTPAPQELSPKFLKNEATISSVPPKLYPGWGSDDTLRTWVAEAGQHGKATRELAYELLINDWNSTATQGQILRLRATFDSKMGLYNSYFQKMGDMEAQCGREGLEWTYSIVEVHPWLRLQKLYYQDLDNALTTVAGGAGGGPPSDLATRIQDLYAAPWWAPKAP